MHNPWLSLITETGSSFKDVGSIMDGASPEQQELFQQLARSLRDSMGLIEVLVRCGHGRRMCECKIAAVNFADEVQARFTD